MGSREHRVVVARFPDRERASLEVADRVASAISRRLAEDDEASIVMSGGSTPARCLRALARAELPWEQVTIVPSDERWVPVSDENSNEGSFRRTLAGGEASKARFFSLFREGERPEGAIHLIESELRALASPFACAVLGMGADGHFASLFPDAESLAEGIDPEGERLVVAVQTAASPYGRSSLTLSALRRADEVLLLFFGEEKWRVFEEARASRGRYPVSHLLAHLPVRAVWAP